MINYEGIVIRPPSEAESLILQVTLGCTDNNCIFCPAYKNKDFKIKDINLIEQEIKQASFYYPDTRRIFLADGDAIVINQNDLLTILKMCSHYFPKLSRISVYGSAKSLEHKTIDNLKELKENKLGIIYLGIETGDAEVYKLIKKYGDPDFVTKECIKIKESGIKLNTTLILGLGGKRLSEQHAINSAKILNKIKPTQIALLTLMIQKPAPIYYMVKNKEFDLLNKFDILKEMYLILKNLGNFKCLFFSNHASNYLPISARFPKEKEEIMNSIYDIIINKDENFLSKEFSRGL